MSNENPNQDEVSAPRSRKGPDWITLGILGALLIAVVVLFIRGIGAIQDSPPDPGEHARIMPIPREITDFSLVDHRGEAFGLDRLQGQWSLLLPLGNMESGASQKNFFKKRNIKQ